MPTIVALLTCQGFPAALRFQWGKGSFCICQLCGTTEWHRKEFLGCFFQIFSGRWLRRATAVVGGDDDVDDDGRANRDGMIPRTHGDDKDDADGGTPRWNSHDTLPSSHSMPGYNCSELLAWYANWPCFSSSSISTWCFWHGQVSLNGSSCDWITGHLWTRRMRRCLMMPMNRMIWGQGDQGDEKRSICGRKHKETIGHLYWKRLEVPLNDAPRCVDLFWVVEKLKLRAWQEVLYDKDIWDADTVLYHTEHNSGQSHLLIAILRKGSAGMQAAWDTYGYVLFYNTRIYA